MNENIPFRWIDGVTFSGAAFLLGGSLLAFNVFHDKGLAILLVMISQALIVFNISFTITGWLRSRG